jgi:hypothetical protein
MPRQQFYRIDIIFNDLGKPTDNENLPKNVFKVLFNPLLQ